MRTLQTFRKLGSRPGAVQIVPCTQDVQCCSVHRTGMAETLAFSSPTGPGGAPGFHNVAGSQIAVPEVTNIYMGPFWGDQNFVEQFSKAVVENGYLDPLKELGYGTGSGTYKGMVTGPTLKKGLTFTDADAQGAVKNLLDKGTIKGNANSLFMLILPDGVTSQLDGASSCQAFCGYHDAFEYKGTSIAYGVLPSSLCSGCGGLIGDFTAVYAHELAEAATDKVPGQGWVADDGEENADLESWVLLNWGPPSNPKLYTIQGYYTIERGNTVGAWRDTSKGAADTLQADLIDEEDSGIAGG